MNIGKRDKPIRIEVPTITNGGEYGEQITTWTTYFEGFASCLDVLPGSREATNQDIRLTQRPVKIETQYMPGLTAKMRVTMLEDGRVLQIVTPPAELGRKEASIFLAEEYSV